MDSIEQLRKWRLEDNLTCKQIAEKLGVASGTVAQRCLRAGIKTYRTGPRSGPLHPGWKGGRMLSASGYWMIYSPNHPVCKGTKHRKYVQEHRLLMEKKLGRFLHRKEVVDHVNGDKTDNRIENLRLFSSNSAHLSHTLKGHAPEWTREGAAKIHASQRQISFLGYLRSAYRHAEAIVGDSQKKAILKKLAACARLSSQTTFLGQSTLASRQRTPLPKELRHKLQRASGRSKPKHDAS